MGIGFVLADVVRGLAAPGVGDGVAPECWNGFVRAETVTGLANLRVIDGAVSECGNVLKIPHVSCWSDWVRLVERAGVVIGLDSISTPRLFRQRMW